MKGGLQFIIKSVYLFIYGKENQASANTSQRTQEVLLRSGQTRYDYLGIY